MSEGWIACHKKKQILQEKWPQDGDTVTNDLQYNDGVPDETTVSMRVNAQCVSDQVQGKQGDGQNTETWFPLSYVIFDNDLWAKQGVAHLRKVSV